MLVPAPAAAVIAAFGQAYTESNGCAQWRSQCKQSTVLESLSAESSILHLVLDLPWPLSDRDLVIKYTVSTDKKSGITRLAGQSLDNYYPLQEQIRAQTMLIYCIKPISHNQTNVVYEMQTQLNGDVPVSLFNTQVVNSTLKDMAELRKTALEAVENLKDG